MEETEADLEFPNQIPGSIFNADFTVLHENNENSALNNPNENLGFDPGNIVKGPPVYIRKKLYYQAYASTTWSVEQATNIIDYIGQKSDSDDCLPFAVKLIENGQLISIAEDNGEFACGQVLERCLKKLEGFNVLVCVTRTVKGCFPTDMVQCQKLHAVKEAAEKALELLHKHLTGADLQPQEELAVDGKLRFSDTPPPPIDSTKGKNKSQRGKQPKR
jgi:hypothetical protein